MLWRLLWVLLTSVLRGHPVESEERAGGASSHLTGAYEKTEVARSVPPCPTLGGDEHRDTEHLTCSAGALPKANTNSLKSLVSPPVMRRLTPGHSSSNTCNFMILINSYALDAGNMAATASAWCSSSLREKCFLPREKFGGGRGRSMCNKTRKARAG